MAHRLATEYTQSRLVLSEQDLQKVCGIFMSHQISVERSGDDVGWCVLRLEKEQEVVLLAFENRQSQYVFEGTFRVKQRDLVNAMREVVATFKGHAIVNRIYQQFTISYYYEHGTVTKIVESNDDVQSMIFEKKHQHGEFVNETRKTATQERLQTVFERNDVELRIAELKKQIDEWLDIRNRLKISVIPDQIHAIDRRLIKLTSELIISEAI